MQLFNKQDHTIGKENNETIIMLKISFVGDINPGGVLTYTGGISHVIIDELAQSDLRVGTLECALGDGKKMCPIKMANPKNGAIIYAPDNTVSTLIELHINVVTLANNHSFDLDEDGYRHTIDLLDRNGIKHLGAGKNLEEASQPLFVEINGRKVCFLAYMEDCVPCIRFATPNSPGVNPFSPNKVIDDIIKYKKESDYIIVLPHWGKENTMWPRPEIMRWCKLFAEAGADAVMGSHTHVAQPVIKYGNCIVSPSMGNFLFPDRYIDNPRITVYPSEKERQNKDIPVVYKYPVVSRLTFKIIRNISRIGEIVSVDFKQPEDSAYSIKFVQLDKNNNLNLQEPNSKYKKDYSIINKCISNTLLYSIIVIIKKIMALTKAILVKGLSKLKRGTDRTK